MGMLTFKIFFDAQLKMMIFSISTYVLLRKNITKWSVRNKFFSTKTFTFEMLEVYFLYLQIKVGDSSSLPGVVVRPGKPVRIVELYGEVPRFNTHEITEIVRKANHRRISVVAVTGPVGSGKSFLLNLMKSYLYYYSQVWCDF